MRHSSSWPNGWPPSRVATVCLAATRSLNCQRGWPQLVRPQIVICDDTASVSVGEICRRLRLSRPQSASVCLCKVAVCVTIDRLVWQSSLVNKMICGRRWCDHCLTAPHGCLSVTELVIKSAQCLHAFYFAEPAGGRLGSFVIHGNCRVRIVVRK